MAQVDLEELLSKLLSRGKKRPLTPKNVGGPKKGTKSRGPLIGEQSIGKNKGYQPGVGWGRLKDVRNVDDIRRGSWNSSLNDAIERRLRKSAKK